MHRLLIFFAMGAVTLLFLEEPDSLVGSLLLIQMFFVELPVAFVDTTLHECSLDQDEDDDG